MLGRFFMCVWKFNYIALLKFMGKFSALFALINALKQPWKVQHSKKGASLSRVIWWPHTESCRMIFGYVQQISCLKTFAWKPSMNNIDVGIYYWIWSDSIWPDEIYSYKTISYFNMYPGDDSSIDIKWTLELCVLFCIKYHRIDIKHIVLVAIHHN